MLFIFIFTYLCTDTVYQIKYYIRIYNIYFSKYVHIERRSLYSCHISNEHSLLTTMLPYNDDRICICRAPWPGSTSSSSGRIATRKMTSVCSNALWRSDLKCLMAASLFWILVIVTVP